MKIAPKNRVQRALAVGTAALALLGSAGCSTINDQATTYSYAASDGIVANVGPILLRNLMLVAADGDSQARVLGTASNTSDSPVQLTVTGTGGTASVTVPANGQIRFEQDENETIVDTPGADPGALVNIDVKVNSESTELGVPVLDGALAEYKPFVPGSGSATPAPAESGAPAPSGSATTEAAEAGH
ncbi:hypothetical protein [Arthrobacter mangrovi]|uniref:DNA modification methylase n=1 Tax=Arthrobacter mangrovi TaxID=2966350 RepID=A0ABQ5MXR1_9MICC|nr:hypothetical protein [Arthrobacter mangrovi]GLB68781.1 hypothetical protein AHIS1636_32240 [Arthrobacter mangrovi]